MTHGSFKFLDNGGSFLGVYNRLGGEERKKKIKVVFFERIINNVLWWLIQIKPPAATGAVVSLYWRTLLGRR